jgi:predicted regulator of Ras-like GTPase activity (Roadblock/LC7/MglB family)
VTQTHLDDILHLLRNFEAENADITGSAVVSIQGLPICSSLGANADDSRDGMIAAMTAAILSVGERAAQELSRGNLRRILLDGEDGLIILQQSGPHAILCVLVNNDKQLGLIFMMMSGLARKIAKILD